MAIIMAHQSKNKQQPSRWVTKHLRLIKPKSTVLDLACGDGRHTILMQKLGHIVTALDINVHQIYRLQGPKIEIIEYDLENGYIWPLTNRFFDLVIVTNYLYRPVLDNIVSALAKDGVLIYETFAEGNELFGKPSNPNFLLKEGELLNICKYLEIISYENRIVYRPTKAKIQRIVARNLKKINNI